MWREDTLRRPSIAVARGATAERWVGYAAAATTWGIVGLLILAPVIHVFSEALGKGLGAYWKHIALDPDTRAAALLSLRVALAAVTINTIFGLSAAWLLSRFQFPGRRFLAAIIDLPLSVSPVVTGLSLVLVFGANGILRPWIEPLGIKVIFAEPGLVLATTIVTFPIVARQLVPLLEAVGAEEELAARSLGASAWQMWSRVTARNIRWGLLHAVLLCSARALGEFGAVYTVSGRISGVTDTLPLRVEKLFQDYDLAGAFAVASLLALLGLVTLAAKTFLERKTREELEQVATAVSEPSGRPPQGAGREENPPFAPPVRVHTSREETETRPGMSPGIRVEGIRKSFGRFVALDGVSFSVPEGSLLALLGPSGSGKTTLLRIIAGLEEPDGGAVFYRGRDVTGHSPHQRNVGFVFQHYALFRHMTVYENVAFGLRVRRWSRERIDRRVRELLHLVRLDGFENKRPSQLSGGQRQRVALARALAPEPEVLLLDEPFGALDAKVRRELRDWLRRLHDEIGVTSVFVTHDQEEAFEVADQVVLLNHGRVEQAGSPVEVFEHPANAFVTEFLGYVNKLPGWIRDGQAIVGPFAVAYEEGSREVPSEATAYVRPHELEVDRIPRGVYSVQAQVIRVHPTGGTVKLELFAVDFGMPLRVELTWERYAQLRPEPGGNLFVFPKRMRIFVNNYQI
jgi:sulfate transport system ATP-binding protein